MSIVLDITADNQAAQSKLYIVGTANATISIAQAGPGSLAGSTDVYWTKWQRDGSGYLPLQAQPSFLLTGLPAGAVITKATLEMKGIDFAANPTSQDVAVAMSSWDGEGNLVAGDFDDLTSFTEVCTRFSFPTGSYGVVTQTLNATAIAAIQAAVAGSIAFTLAVEDAVDGNTITGFDSNTVMISSESGTYGGPAPPILHLTYYNPGENAQLGCNF